MVKIEANYAQRRHDGILVLQRGENASTDYYIRGRLTEADIPVQIADLETSPDDCSLLQGADAQALLVIICRYASTPWLEALQRRRGRLARVAFFLDDDLPAMISDTRLPHTVRSKVALHYGEHVDQLGVLASELWVSSAVLAQRYSDLDPALLEPLPEGEPPEPAGPSERRIVYHGTDVHGPERRFVIEVARLLAKSGCDAPVELTGDTALKRACAGLANVTVVPQLAWPAYRRSQLDARAAISLAPLTASVVNDARAPVKAFDAARIGATGLFADAPPYRAFVRPGVDGLLLPMSPEAWASAISELLADPHRRIQLAEAARRRQLEMLESRPSLPAPRTT